MSVRTERNTAFTRIFAWLIIASLVFSSLPSSAFSAKTDNDHLRNASTLQSDNPSRKNFASDLNPARDGGDFSERILVNLSELRKNNVDVAGGKSSNLGELMSVPLPVPGGVATTTKAFKIHLEQNFVDYQGRRLNLEDYIVARTEKLDYNNMEELAAAALEIRETIEKADMPEEVEREIRKAYAALGDDVPVAVRSSATAEDLPEASFAGQQETFLNVRGIDDVLEYTKKCWASLYNARAMAYRKPLFEQLGLEEERAYLSVVIQHMVKATKAGVAFSVDLETGLPGVNIDANLGLGEAVVGGDATPDNIKVVYDTKTGEPKIIKKILGRKLTKVVYSTKGTEFAPTTAAERGQICLTDEQIIELARMVKRIHEHYGKFMDVEWAVDENGKIWILQARPETTWNKKNLDYGENTVVNILAQVPEEAAKKAKVLLTGVTGAVKAAVGKVVIVRAPSTGTEAEKARALGEELAKIKEGDIMVTPMTKPDMVPAMKVAGAFVTDEGGPTCHAAIVARELEKPCIVGTGTATAKLKDGMIVTVDANRGRVYEGDVEIEEVKDQTDISKLPVTKTLIGIINSAPDLAMRIWKFAKYASYYGYGLVRKEFADTTEILVHPLAGLAYDKYNNADFKDEAQRAWIKENVMDEYGEMIKTTIAGYASYEEFYIDKLATLVARIASAQVKGQRIKYRTTDFKTNEYQLQKGALPFEPFENNPMMGYRGVFRMLHPNYIEAFRLEVRALKRAREIQSNIDIMFPVVRSVEELEAAVKVLAEEGIFDVVDKPSIGMMVEVPANVFQVEDFYDKLMELARKYKTTAFMSIGSNDLTQFTLGLGRDNDKMRPLFSEADPAVKRALEIVIKSAKKEKYMVVKVGKGKKKTLKSIITTGLCGQRPSNDPAFAGFLVEAGIDSISLAPDAFKKVVEVVAQVEKEREGIPFDPAIAGWEIPATMGTPRSMTARKVQASEIIKAIGIHPQALVTMYNRAKVKEVPAADNIKNMVYDTVFGAVINMVKATPEDVPIMYVTDDLLKTEYDNLKQSKGFEQELDENPQLGFAGLARVADADYQEFFRWQLKALRAAREHTGRKNIGIQFNLVTNLDNVRKALEIMRDEGFVPGRDGLMVGMDISKPSNVLLLNELLDLGLTFLNENNERFLSYDMALDPGSKYVDYPREIKDKALLNPRKVWTTIAQNRDIPMVAYEDVASIVSAPAFTTEELAPLIQPAAPAPVIKAPQVMPGFEVVRTSSKIVYDAFQAKFQEFSSSLAAITPSEQAAGVVILGVNTVLDNGGTAEALSLVVTAAGKDRLPVFVWAGPRLDTDAKEKNIQEAISAAGLSDITQTAWGGLDELLAILQSKYNLPPDKIMVVLNDKDTKMLPRRFKAKLSEFLNTYRVQATLVKEAEAGRAISMPLVISHGIARLLNREIAVVQAFLSVAQTYRDQLPSEDLAALTELSAGLTQVTDFNVDESTDEAARVYKETMRDIAGGV